MTTQFSPLTHATLVEVFVDDASVNQSIDRYIILSGKPLDEGKVEAEVARHSVGSGSEYVAYQLDTFEVLAIKDFFDLVAKAIMPDASFFDDRFILVDTRSGVVMEYYETNRQADCMYDFAKCEA